MAAPTKRYTTVMRIPYKLEGAQPDDADLVDQMNETDAVSLYALQLASLVINADNFAWNSGTGELDINNLVMTASFGGGTFSISAPISLPPIGDGTLVYITGIPSGLWSSNLTISAGQFATQGAPPATVLLDRIFFGKRKGSEFYVAIPGAQSLT